MEADFSELTLSQKREHYERLAADIPDAKDITEKMFMARNVVLTKPKAKSKATNVVKTMQLTGASEETVKSAIATSRNSIRFYEVVVNGRSRPSEDILFLRDIITDLYVEKRVVPTIKQIMECIQEPVYTHKLLNDLKCLGYIWKRLPGTDASVLVENSEQLYNRINYLRKIIEYRRNGRCLVYVRYIPSNGQAFAASPSFGLLHWAIYPHSPYLDQWFRRIILPLLPMSCVVVIDSKEIVGSMRVKVPAPISAKSDMIKWLEAEDIPHNPSWHRAELYKLVEAYKLNNEQEIETLHKQYSETSGHDFLIAPDQWPSLNYFTDIVEGNMKDMKPEEWLEHDAKLAQREVKIYQDSIKFEKIIDQLFTMATYEDVREMSKNLERYVSKDTEEYVSNIIFE